MNKEERKKLLTARLSEKKLFDEKYLKEGTSILAGVDEVGRGPLAGPVVAACVILPKDFDILGIDDSKKVSQKKREELAAIIKDKARAYGLAMASEQAVDKVNILEATKGAMEIAIARANEMLQEREGKKIDHILLDAVKLDNIDISQSDIIGGDSKSLAIAAASIVAKVTRDYLMVEYSKEYPGYDFEHNKGYGTKAHYAGIKQLGICPIHRKSFLKNLNLK